MRRAAAAALLCASALGHPSSLSCNDPRFREGGIIMHNWVTANQYNSDLLVEASASKYDAGETVTLSVKANGTMFKGAYLAVQAFSLCTLQGDHGVFVTETKDLSKKCDNVVFSNAAFTGESVMKWTAGPLTTGPLTFKVMWGNGPASSDPLAVKGIVRTPNSYLYMKTVTLSYTGPPPHCPAISPSPVPPPAPVPGRPNACVQTGRCSGEGVGSPVFIQTLGGEDGKQTFPSGRCIPCRIDHRHRCRSAMVSCPTSWSSPQLVEKIWTKNAKCSGEPDRVVTLPDAHAHCPGVKHYGTSAEQLDLERFVPKLQRDHGSYFADEKTARAAIREYRRMLTLIQRFPKQPVVPSKLVDLVWHEHILDTQQYKRDCLRMFGEYIHHNPSFGGAEEKEQLVADQKSMFSSYEVLFGEAPPAATWPQPVKSKADGTGVPDCCSAKCAKPNCHNCVGCNSVDCAYMLAKEDAAPRGVASRLSPEAAAGYVPVEQHVAESAQAVDVQACAVSPEKDMQLRWSICDGDIHFEHTLKDENGGWYAVGLSGKEPFVDMSQGDYAMTLPTGNYTGVKDMYRWQPGNGYPCFDVEYECSSGNKTKGSYDFKNAAISRKNGVTQSTWSRPLDTGDSKDMAIKSQNMTVMFARGHSDYVYYHQGDRNLCTIDFFSGLTSCQPTKEVPGSPELVRQR
eukprot:TRINITY_DN100_c0_g1_i3.p1 TRINITY_DN100_c0_g1~~TRINITY_DN100_c0_g1_i3.p1  ORF type:complete len:682 (+),score=261.19 TRINITY_DN100_c0_g1_i3:76-2121(+)